MRKYAYSIIIISFIILVFSWRGLAYLTNQAESSELSPLYLETDFELEDVWAGIEIEALDYKFLGELNPFYLIHNKPPYTQQGAFSSLDSFFDPFLDELVGQHRSFFRGKQYTHSFYVDDTFIISAEIKMSLISSSPEMLSIELLERQNEVSLSFSMPFADDLFSSHIVDIQIHHSKLYVAVEEYNYRENKLVMYEFDPSDPSSIRTDELFKVESTDSVGMFQVAEKATHTGRVNFNVYFPPSPYLSWYSINEDSLIDPYSYSNEPYELFSYSYDLNETESVLIADMLDLSKSEGSWWAIQDQANLILLEPFTSDITTETGYASVSLNNLNEINYHPFPSESYHSYHQVINGLLYRLSVQPPSAPELAILNVIDPATQELLYQGSIQSNDPLIQIDDYNFEFLLLQNNGSP